MTAKQLGGVKAPDGSDYVTLTDGAGNLSPAGSGTVTQGSPPWAVDIVDSTNTNISAVKAASTASVATDPSLVVQLNPLSPGIIALGQATKSASVPVVIASDQGYNDYPVGAIPLTASATGTTAATTATLAASVGKTTYLVGFSIRATATAAAVGNATVTGTITGTLNFTQFSQAATTGMVPVEPPITKPIPASATNTAIAVISAAPGTGGVVSVTAWGYQL